MPTEEQNEELEVLKSIYDTRYSGMTLVFLNHEPYLLLSLLRGF